MRMKTMHILGRRKKVILNHSNTDILFMESISKEEEELIDNSLEQYTSPRLILENSLTIYPSNIYLYGSVDLDDEHDIKLLLSKDIISDSIMEAAIIPSNFDYDNNIIYSNKNDEFLYHNTWDTLTWFKYNYCLIGKPERIIIYKLNRIEYINYLHKYRINKYGDSRSFMFK